MITLQGRHALIFGVASADSIAWAVAKTLSAAGATISLGYQQRFKSRLLQLCKSNEVPVQYCERCDVTQPSELEQFFAGLPQDRPELAHIDILMHSVAYTSPETFAKPIHQITAEEFTTALITSAYSLLPLVAAAKPRMRPGSSVIAMTYLGGQRVVANYKLMGIAKAALDAAVRELAADVGAAGIRVNAISAGPIQTLAASQISGFGDMLKVYEAVSPLRRCVHQADVGNAAAFLASDLSRNITGQVLFVDAGYSILAMAELPHH